MTEMAHATADIRTSGRLIDDPLTRSAVGIGALVTVLAGTLVALNQVGYFDLGFILKNWSFLIGPAITALEATTLSFLGGCALGVPLGWVRAFGPRMIRDRGLRGAIVAPAYAGVTGYVEAVRGTPAFVQILLIHSATAQAFPGLPNLAFWAGVAALFVNAAGYQTETFRAGLQSVGQGQIEAAKSVGMRPVQVFTRITLPQSLRLIALPLANDWIGLFKASALLWYVAVQELMWAGSYLSYTLVHPVEAFLMVAFVYLIIIIPLGKAVSYLERVYRIPGLGVPEAATARRGRGLAALVGWPRKPRGA